MAAVEPKTGPVSVTDPSNPNDASTPSLASPPPPPKQTRRRRSWKTILFTIASIIYVSLTSQTMGYISRWLYNTKGTHSLLHQDTSAPYTEQEVVRPLVDDENTFDVVATVWMRDVEGKGEKAVFSDVVFRGLRLKDKDVKTQVELKVPTAIFKARDLTYFDLRSAFVLIPTSPSALENATSHSSWIPQDIKFPAMRPYSPGHQRTLPEEIVDAYGTLAPLIALQGMPSRCTGEVPTIPERAEDAIGVYDEISLPGNLFDKWRVLAETTGKGPLEAHPYIITRTHLRAAVMTKLYNKHAFDEGHLNLTLGAWKSKDGSSLTRRTSPSYWRELVSRRSFEEHANLETKIVIKESPAEDVQYYAPYLDVSPVAWGPLDLVAVPVNREGCTPTQLDQEFLDFTWNIAFSGLTPAEFAFANSMVPTYREFDMTETDEVKQLYQNNIEVLEGILGHRFVDFHPRRGLLLSSLSLKLSIIEPILSFYYWYSRRSLSGFSPLAGTLLMGAEVVDTSFVVLSAYISEEEWVLDALSAAIPTLYVVRLLWLLRKTLPSSRSGVKRSSLLMLYAILAITFFFFNPHTHHLISPRGPQAPPRTGIQALLVTIQSITVLPSIIIGNLLQFQHNFTYRTFAGASPWGSALKTASTVLIIASATPAVVGTLRLNDGIPVWTAVEGSVSAILLWQALRYPAAENEKPHEKKE